MIPHGSVELSCAVGGLPQILGPQTVPRVETLAPGATVVGVRFQLGAAPSVLGVPASELVDISIPAGELWGDAAARIGERVAEADDAAGVLEQEVLIRAAQADGADPVVAEVGRRLLPGRGEDVMALPSELFVSERQLRRRVQAGIGLAPKVVHRMLRFQGFLALTHGRDGDPAELAQARRRGGLRRPVASDPRVCAALRALAGGAHSRVAGALPRRAPRPLVSYAPLLHGLP